MPQEEEDPPLPAAPAVGADVEAEEAEPVAVVPMDLAQLRSPQFGAQPLLLELPLVPVAARLRLAEVALLAAAVKLVKVAEVLAPVLLLPLRQSVVALKCRASRSSTCCWLPV
jgi:hypothetical protein